MDWLTWIVEHWEVFTTVLSIVVGILWGAFKIANKLEDISWDAFWRFALQEGKAYLDELAKAAQREITEADVKAASLWIWDMVNGPEEYADEFADALWALWRKLGMAKDSAVRSGLVPPTR